MPPKKVIIIGAGFAGPAFALLLKKSNPPVDITIYELREAPTTLGLAINLTCNGLRVFDALGIYKEMEDECADTPEFECFNPQGKHFGTVKMGHYTKEKYGYGCMRAMRSVVHSKLLRRLGEENITIKMGMNLVKIDEMTDSVECTFADGTKDSCDMLVGADGIHSVVRSLRVDPTCEPKYTGMSSVGSIVNIKDITSPIYFKGNFGTIWTSKGMFATGYCDKTKENIYWFNSHTVEAKSREGWTEYGKGAENIKAGVLERIKDIQIPFAKELVEKTPELTFYPVYNLPLGGRWYTKRCILIGDAAHAMPPYVGQGTSAAMEDAVILTRLLENTDDLYLAFSKFDKIRRPRIREIFGYANKSGDMRREKGPWALWAQEKMLSWVFAYVPEKWMATSTEYNAFTVPIDVDPDKEKKRSGVFISMGWNKSDDES